MNQLAHTFVLAMVGEKGDKPKKKGGGGEWNPFDGLTPSFGPFRTLLESRVNTLLALVWVCALAYLGYRLIVNLAAFAKARKGRYGSDLNEAKEDLTWSAGAVVAVAAAGSIYGVLVVF